MVIHHIKYPVVGNSPMGTGLQHDDMSWGYDQQDAGETLGR